MTTEAIARPAATILPIRDGARGLEVFMVVRHHQIDFASGALVFPGGRVDRGDHTLAANPIFCPEPTRDMAFRIAAIRETFEECGILLARPLGTDRLVDAQELQAIEARHRAPLAAGEIGFDIVLAENRLMPATDLLVHYAHWITPNHQPKRYDTQFYLVAAPAEHLAAHDGHESVDSVWIRPAQALAETEAGRFKLVFATMKNLEKLARRSCVADAMAMARASMVVTVQPKSAPLDDGRRKLIIPVEAGYGGPEFIVDIPPAS
jgi:8-oxo-dGTP pyrophosphatase MutT (NUDIX family)